jgi:CRISPR system Cascade subunit CasD
MRDYLVFQLYGPLLSWGDIAVGETRPSALTPSKSAVLGLVAAALGIKRPDTVADETERMACEKLHAELAQGYGLGVFVQVLGSPLSDYHTAQVPSSGTGRNRKTFPTRRDELIWLPRADLNTILSRREYRQDAFCTVALWTKADAPYPLDNLRKALLAPRFPLYLGRKSCPLALPLAPRIVEDAESLEMVFPVQTPWSLRCLLIAQWGKYSAKQLLRKADKSTSWLLWDTDAEIKLDHEQAITRRDQPLSRRRWQFSVREERRASWPAGGMP